MLQKVSSEVNESMKSHLWNARKCTLSERCAFTVPWPGGKATVTSREKEGERRYGMAGKGRSPMAAHRLVSLDAEVQETQSGAQPSAFAYRDEAEGDRDRWMDGPRARGAESPPLLTSYEMRNAQPGRDKTRCRPTSPLPRSQRG